MSRLGRHIQTAVAGERFNAFVPPPLPPDPAIDLSAIQPLLDRANQAIGRLDGAGLILPNPNLFVYMAVRLAKLQMLGIVSELSGRSWGRSFAFDAYLRLLSEGTEPLTD